MNNNLRSELIKWDTLRSQLEDMEGLDEQTLLDTLDGETNLTDALLSMADEIQEREAQMEGLEAYRKRLSERKSRIDGTVATLRKAIHKAMERAGLPKIQGDRVTLSLRAVAAGLIITDEAQIPKDYWKDVAPQLDRNLVLKALRDGYEIPGALLGNGGQSLAIRVK